MRRAIMGLLALVATGGLVYGESPGPSRARARYDALDGETIVSVDELV
jgi:hypothetical protein